MYFAPQKTDFNVILKIQHVKNTCSGFAEQVFLINVSYLLSRHEFNLASTSS